MSTDTQTYKDGFCMRTRARVSYQTFSEVEEK